MTLLWLLIFTLAILVLLTPSWGIGRWLGVRSPDERVEQWHVSPAVDIMSYSFSWVWVLLPMLFYGGQKVDYIAWYLLILAATDVHRHIGFPYVYMDKQVYGQYPVRFTLFPLVLFAAWIFSPWLELQPIRVSAPQVSAGLALIFIVVQVMRLDGGEEGPSGRELARDFVVFFGPAALGTFVVRGLSLGVDPGWFWLAGAGLLSPVLVRRARAKAQRSGEKLKSGWGFPLWMLVFGLVAATGPFVVPAWQSGKGVPIRSVLNAVAVFAFAWNLWHVYMQKYGIIRLYNAKSGKEDKVPGWVDRMLIFAWLPLFVAWLGPANKHLMYKHLRRGRDFIGPAVEFLDTISVVTVPLTVAFLLGAILLWVRYEWRVNRLRNAPRLWMAIGTTLLSACFLGFDPVKAYLAFAFSHAVEYMVFVWAYQRRRYQTPLAHRPSLGKILRSRPFLSYAGFILALGGLFLYLKYWGLYIETDWERPRDPVLDIRTSKWISYWGIYQSMVHFYFDGFLWKMRMKTVRANI